MKDKNEKKNIFTDTLLLIILVIYWVNRVLRTNQVYEVTYIEAAYGISKKIEKPIIARLIYKTNGSHQLQILKQTELQRLTRLMAIVKISSTIWVVMQVINVRFSCVKVATQIICHIALNLIKWLWIEDITTFTLLSFWD